MPRLPGFNRITDLIRLTDTKKYDILDRIGQFCVSKMDYYVPYDTGYLQSKNEYKVTKYFHQKLTLKNEAHYALFIEYGTYKMLAQPFIRPSVFNHVSEINAIIGQEWRLV